MQNPLHEFNYCPRCGKDGFTDTMGRAKYCSFCGLTYFHNVAAAVACLVRDKSGRYLFVRRANEPARGTLDLAGGFVDPLESAEDAVARELREETGLTPLKIKYLGSRPNRYPYSGIDVYTADLFFLVEVASVDVATPNDDAAEIVITSLEELSADLFGLESIHQFMQEVLSGKVHIPQ